MRNIAEAIDALEFGTVFVLRDGDGMPERIEGADAPEVMNDPDTDVTVTDGWECITRMTRQYSYNGAVMHRSEYVSVGIAECLAEIASDAAEDGKRAQFAIVMVDDPDGGDPDGWAIAYRTITG